MAQGDKSAYYRALKAAGFTFDQHYREYTTEDLKKAWELVAAEKGLDAEVELPAPKSSPPPPKTDEIREMREMMRSLADTVENLAVLVTSDQRRQEQASRPLAAAGAKLGATPQPAPTPQLDPNQHAGVTLNTHTNLRPIEVDEYGNEWYQKEVAKPAFPKPRGRRVLRYDDPGVRREKIKVGDYVEEFEVAGDVKNSRPSEIKITLPSYQTGIYKPPNMPFRVHTYNGVRGFNLFDVEAFYGGPDLVPSDIKRCYVSTDLCYDITSTIRTIENEYRERVLKSGKGL